MPLFVLLLLTCCSFLLQASPPVWTPDQLAQIQLPDVRIESVTHHSAEEKYRNIRVGHVVVLGKIGGSIGFECLFPDEWNQRFVMGGGGGLVGSIQNAARGYANEGYATVGTDTGHQAGGTDGSWALNNVEALVNFGHVAVHRTAEVAKALIRSYYGNGPTKSYFFGCSRGGGQALMEAQRYPEDFDGIVSGAPAFDWTGIAAMGVHMAQALYPDPNHLNQTLLGREDLERLYEGIMEQVDAQDGLKDGIIEDPSNVVFNLAKVSGLSAEQQAVIQAIYEGPVRGGRSLYPGFPLGAEAGDGGWYQWITGPVPDLVSLSFAFSTNIMKFFLFNDPEWDYATYDFSDWDKDSELAASVLSAVDPNLQPFASRGGKLILWHGWSDAALPAQATIDYYQQVLNLDPKAMDHTRLFMIPGCYHCGGGPGISQVDWLAVLVDWVEGGIPPDRIIARKGAAQGSPEKTRPLFPYPDKAQYDGEGDIHDASSFVRRKP